MNLRQSPFNSPYCGSRKTEVLLVQSMSYSSSTKTRLDQEDKI